ATSPLVACLTWNDLILPPATSADAVCLPFLWISCVPSFFSASLVIECASWCLDFLALASATPTNMTSASAVKIASRPNRCFFISIPPVERGRQRWPDPVADSTPLPASRCTVTPSAPRRGVMPHSAAVILPMVLVGADDQHTWLVRPGQRAVAEVR